MPIEIRELIIKVVIVPPEGRKKIHPEGIPAATIERLRRDIKQECINELKQFIIDQKER